MASSRAFKMGAIEAAVVMRDYMRAAPSTTADGAAAVLRELAMHHGLDFASGRELIGLFEPDEEEFGLERKAFVRELLWRLVRLQRPLWGVAAPYGRQRVKAVASPDDVQCLREAGLYDFPANDSVVRWWSRVAEMERSLADARRSEIGSAAEALTMERESALLAGLGTSSLAPRLASLEDASLGYDIESYRIVDGTALTHRIEVKGCIGRRARFHVTRNEWTVATAAPSGTYEFHVWLLDGPTLSVLSVAEVEPHVPQDRGAGRWESVLVTLAEDEA